MHLLTDRVLNIPMAVAAKYAHPNTELYEEVVSMGNQALLAAAVNFDPDRMTAEGKFASFPTYAYKCVRLKVRSMMALENQFQNRQRLFGRPEEVGGGELDAAESVWTEEVARLPRKDRRLLELHYKEGKDKRSISREYGGDYGTVRDVRRRLKRILSRLREELEAAT